MEKGDVAEVAVDAERVATECGEALNMVLGWRSVRGTKAIDSNSSGGW